MITINKLAVKNTEGKILFGAENLTLEPGATGRVYGVVGPSGCGKTTLLKAFLGLVLPAQIEENKITGDFRRPAYLSQRPVIFPHLNAEQNAKYFARSTEHRARHDDICARADALAGYLQVDFERLNRTNPEKWSGGEQQRLALIRGLSIEPDVLFLDEPCNGLDPCVRWELLSFLRQHVLANGLLAVYVSHYSDELVRISDEILAFTGEAGTARTIALHSLADLTQAPNGIAEYISPGNYVGTWADHQKLGPLGIEAQRVYPPEEIEVRSVPASTRKIEQIFRFGQHAQHAVIELTGGIRLIVPSNALPAQGTSVTISPRT